MKRPDKHDARPSVRQRRLGVLWAATKTKEQANERSRDATQTAISVPAIRSEDANAPGCTFRLALRW